MAVVGEATIRVTANSSGLARDIRRDVQRAADQASAESERRMGAAGQRGGSSYGSGFRRGMGTQIRRDVQRASNEAGNESERRMGAAGDRGGRSYGVGFGRGVGGQIRQDVRRASNEAGDESERRMGGSGERGGTSWIAGFANVFRRGGVRNSVRRAADEAGDESERRFRNGGDRGGRGFLFGFGRGLTQGRNNIKKSAGEFTGNLSNVFVTKVGKIGASAGSAFAGLFSQGLSMGLKSLKIGGAIAGVLAAPGALGGLATAATSLVASAVSAISSLGPALGGFAVGASAALQPLITSFLLIKLGFDSLDKQQQETFGRLTKNLKATFGKPIAFGMFKGLTEALAGANKAIAGNRGITKALIDLGKTFGGVAKDISKTITSATNLKLIGQILQTNNGFVKNFGAGLKGLVSAFIPLLAALRPVTKEIGEMFKQFGQWAAGKTVGQVDSLTKTFTRLWDAAKRLTGIIVDLGKGIWNVFKASAPAGAGMLKTLEKTGAAFAKWTGSKAGQKSMIDFFGKMRQLSSALFGATGDLVGGMGKALASFDITPILRVIDILQKTLGPALASIFKQMSKGGVGTPLIDMFDGLSKAIGRLADSGAVGRFSESFRKMFDVLLEFTKSDLGPALASIFTPLFDLFKQLFGISEKDPSKGITKTLESIGAALKSVADSQFVAKLAENFGKLYAQLDKFSQAQFGVDFKTIAAGAAAIGVAFSVLSGPIMAVLRLFTPVIGVLKLLWSTLGLVVEAAGLASEALGLIGVSVSTGGILAIIGVLVLAYAKSENFRTAIGHLVGTVVDGFKTIWEAVGPNIKDIIGLLGELGSAIGDALAPVVERLLPVFRTVFETIGNILRGLSRVIKGVLEIIIGIFTLDFGKIWQGIQDVFKGIMGTIGGALKGIGELIGNGLVFILGVFEDIFRAIGTKVAEVWEGYILPFLAQIWERIKIDVTTAWNGILEFFKGIFAFIVQTFVDFKDAAVEQFTLVTTWFGEVWQNILNGVTTGWNAIYEFISGIIAGVIQTFIDFKDAAVLQFTQVMTWFGEVWANITTGITTAWNAIIAFFGQAWATITTGITTAWNAVIQFFTTVWTNIMTIATTVWTSITTAISTAVTAVSTFIRTVWNGIATFIRTVLTSIGTTISTVWNNITTRISAAMNTVKTTVSTAWTNILQTVSRILTSILGTVGRIWNSISTTISGILNGLKGTVSTAWNGIKTAITSVWNTLSGLAATAFNAVKTAVMTPINELKGLVGTAFEQVKAAITRIWDGLAGLAGRAFEAVKQAILAPLNGLQGAVESALSGVKGVIDDIVGWVGDKVGKITDMASKVTGAIAKLNPFGQMDMSAFDAFAHVPLKFDLVMPKIPALAAGGIVYPQTGGVVTRIAEAGKPERVEPLAANGLSQRDMALINQLTSNSNQNIGVRVYIGETELTGLVQKQIDYNDSSTARSLMTGRKSMFT